MRIFIMPFFYISIVCLSLFLLGSIWLGNPFLTQKVSGESGHYYDIILDQKKPNPKATTPKNIPPPLINAPLIDQKPNLVRGCEVTSLAMLLQTAGIKVDKMTLASQITKDPTPYSVVNGTIHFGNPNKGFVGDMYDRTKPGYGVYHGPLMALAQTYLGKRAVDLSGMSFGIVINQLKQGLPVLVITSTTFKKVPQSEWQTWETESGPIKVSNQEHAVLLTGYTDQTLFLNDPLTGQKNKAVNRSEFEQAWEQFGNQAISYKKK